MAEIVDSDGLTGSEKAIAYGWEKLKRRRRMKRKVRNWKKGCEVEKAIDCVEDVIGCAMQFERRNEPQEPRKVQWHEPVKDTVEREKGREEEDSV